MTIEPITDIDYQGTRIIVTDLPQAAQHTVARMNEWRQEEVDVASKLEMIQTALEMLNLSLTEQVAHYVQEQQQNQVSEEE